MCGIIGLVFGAIGFVLSFIPIVNNVAPFFGGIGVILAVIGIVSTFRGRKRGKVLSIIAAVLSILAIVITLVLQAAASKALDDLAGAASTTTSSSNASDAAKSTKDSSEQASSAGVQDGEGDLASAHVTIVSAVNSDKDFNGASTVLVTYQWKNNTDSNNSFLVLVNPQVFQHGQALDTATYTGNPAGYDVNSSLAEVQPGAAGTATIGYVLKDDSAVSVEVTDLFSLDDKQKVSHTYQL